MLNLKEFKDSQSMFRCLDKLSKSSGPLCLFPGMLEDSLLNGKYDYNIDYDIYLPKYDINLQRPYVWNEIQQEELIFSLLSERQIPPIVVVSHEWKSLQIIDGKQRLWTLKRYLSNEFPIYFNGNEYYYKDLDKDLKYFLNKIGVIQAIIYYSYDAKPITDDQKIALFNYYNFAGTPQEITHKDKLIKLFNNK